MPWKKIALGVVLLALAGGFFALGLQEHLTFEAAKASQARLQDFYHEHPGPALLGFAAGYLAMVVLNLPGATIMGLLAGAIFGGLVGTVVVSFASSLGATLACLMSRYLLRGWVQRMFPQVIATMDQGMAREGAFYLFSLRLIPVVPFFVINLAMGLTAMRLRTFYWVSQLGMLPGTIVYVNAGSELGRLTSPADIFSPRLLLALALLGLLPLAGKKGLAWYRRRTGNAPSGPAVPSGQVAPSGPAVPGGQGSSAPVPSEEVSRQAGAIAAACTDCGACVRQCPFLQDAGTPGAIARSVLEGRAIVDPHACSLCGLCEAVCPEGVTPAEFFLTLRREAVAGGRVDLSRYARLLGYERRGHSHRFAWYPPRQAGGTGTVFFPGCTLPGTRPDITWRFFERLRQDIPDLTMVLDCCHKPSHDLGRQAYFLERFGLIRDRLLALGVTQVLTACPNCHKVFARYGAPLTVTTVYEHLAGTMPAELSPSASGPAVVVHDPCPLRREEGIHRAVRTLLAARGVAVKSMKHSGRRTLCCGEGGGVGLHRPDLAKAWTSRRASLAGSTPIVTYCAGCAGFLARVAPTMHLGEVLFAPEQSPTQSPERALAGRSKVAKAPMTYVHRLRLKRRLARMEAKG
ncbi:VTT domain-containing protein [Megalodesulfovibrio gigas]|uniref:4Fe-4S ferredoxin-type domain-containing protein n=1 Tax=Megalodesulfovibrio gigas (strain ATCC 19364 / DSM 1382 / NCIMB 9332 / VKM B-1759) TaxID=1121448 RepID=T2GB83_MEGG1|nr:VTT domain-containing protein [Megalodesulfovibrio gigas]AGW13391.1 hypothetical protein DGI_1551 [Megalodesulfovibrio gigas DSM 1382 = ATCC 19364]